MLHFIRRSALTAVAFVGLVIPAAADSAQPPDRPLGPFYAAPEGAKEAERGDRLRKQPLAGDELIDGAAKGWKVLYSSRGYRRQKIVVSGQVFVPEGKPPKGGWPVISYAHGTVGLINRCAPSYRHDLPSFYGEYLKAGFAFAVTDYEGLGPAGSHPYLNGTMEAFNVVDMVRAARQTTPGLSKKWMAVGQSQGGQATLFTAARATKKAPELDYRGGIATAPPSHWRELSVGTTDTGRVLTPIVFDGLSFFDPNIDPAALLNDDGDKLLNAYYTGCLADTVLQDFVEVFGKPLMHVDPATNFDILKESFNKLEPPVKKLDRPLYIAAGGADEFVVPATMRKLASEYKEKGADVTFREFPGVQHRPTAEYALELGIPFARKLFGQSPYSKLKAKFTNRRRGKATGFKFVSELPPPPEGFGSPALRSNKFRFPRGTVIDPNAVRHCGASDEEIQAGGPAVCPAASKVGRGSATVLLGTDATLPLDVTAFAGEGSNLILVLTNADGGVLRILHSEVGRRSVKTALPPIALGGGEEASLTRFSLSLRGGSAKQPMLRTPRKCPASGKWKVNYISVYDAPLGRQTFNEPSRCRKGKR